MILLYDLAGADGRRFSPNCWRTKMALAHKGLSFETKPTRFTDIPKIADGRQKTLPVITDGDCVIGDSAEIADYLETIYPERPSLFGGVSGRALTQFVQAWAVSVLHPGIIDLVLCDIHAILDPVDRDYFRSTRERRFGKPLEQVQAGREQRRPAFRKSLQPFRNLLTTQPWLGGETPLYADYLLFGPFQWARAVSDFPLLEPDDPIASWFEHCLDLFDGMPRRLA